MLRLFAAPKLPTSWPSSCAARHGAVPGGIATGALGDGSITYSLPRGSGTQGTYEADAELELHAPSRVTANRAATVRMTSKRSYACTGYGKGLRTAFGGGTDRQRVIDK